MVEGPRPRNGLLSLLASDELARIARHLSLVDLRFGEALIEPETAIDFVYFVESALISTTTQPPEDVIEVATIGHEGFVGLPVFLGTGSTPLRTFVQSPGRAYRMASEDFERAATDGAGLHRILHRYTQAFLFQVAQSSACNRLHPVEQRAARWITTAHERLARREFTLTHEVMSQMLGVRRPTVTVVVSELRSRHLIAYHRGRMSVTDADGLRAIACNCLGAIEAEYERVLRGVHGP
jgi:CRP-like cAMP-binding protein